MISGLISVAVVCLQHDGVLYDSERGQLSLQKTLQWFVLDE